MSGISRAWQICRTPAIRTENLPRKVRTYTWLGRPVSAEVELSGLDAIEERPPFLRGVDDRHALRMMAVTDRDTSAAVEQRAGLDATAAHVLAPGTSTPCDVRKLIACECASCTGSTQWSSFASAKINSIDSSGPNAASRNRAYAWASRSTWGDST